MPSEALYWSLLLPISFGALFFGSYLIEPRRLINGLLFNLFAIAFLFDLAIWILSSKNLLLIAVMGTLFIIIILLLFALFALHLLWLIWNAIVVWRKESHSMGNMLTLFIALGLVVLELGATYFRRFIPDFVYLPLSFMIIASMVYILISLYNFLTILTIYNLRIPHYNQDYLIVLGAGLLNGDQVSPLLAARINAASKFYRKQVKKGRPAPKIIYSGGQGGDETVSEGFAMQQYAIKSGIPASSTMVEGESKTTFENMQFSARLINARQKTSYRATFFTNNYHLFRAGLFARMAGIHANGIGAATSFYFLPNAVIREYVAIAVMKKRQHMIVFGGILLITLAMFFVQIV
ncbi:YdcF family protein [Lacticaseibacillus saniviri]|nr:YdcF family protein [Lacticaseibacillus saniviri]MCG4282420.1 YdcF family protein [Lacticaseibacillus saniviri]